MTAQSFKNVANLQKDNLSLWACYIVSYLLCLKKNLLVKHSLMNSFFFSSKFYCKINQYPVSIGSHMKHCSTAAILELIPVQNSLGRITFLDHLFSFSDDWLSDYLCSGEWLFWSHLCIGDWLFWKHPWSSSFSLIFVLTHFCIPFFLLYWCNSFIWL